MFRGQQGFAAVDAAVTEMLRDPKFQRDMLPELAATDPLAWAEEGLELCRTVAYKGDDGFLKLAVMARAAGPMPRMCRCFPRIMKKSPRKQHGGGWSLPAIALRMSLKTVLASERKGEGEGKR